MIKLFVAICLLYGVDSFSQDKGETNMLPKPTPNQLSWQKMETTAFLHFTVNTFTDKEWGDGTESPSIFNPEHLDARQWIRTLRDAGFKLAIITAKHHDGFCLWPSKFTEHSVKSSPWKGGKGDVVKEVADACKEYGLKFGFYLSPWDQHEPSYGTPQYNDFYKKQLTELLTNYGEVTEVWFDGAKGKNAKDMVYDFDAYWNLVRKLQPKAVLFSDAGPDVRWVGNESGNAAETCWSTINKSGIEIGKADARYLNTGDPNGVGWVPAETDVSIRPGWFYHPKENNKVKSASELVNIYYQSVGRNSLLLLNVPPNRDGLFSKEDSLSLVGFRKILNETFAVNFIEGALSKKLTDKKLETHITLQINQPLIINLKKETTFNQAMFGENIATGQRVEEAKLEYFESGEWKLIASFSTIGYKRLLRFKDMNASRLRFTVLKAKGEVQLAEVGLYKYSATK